MSRVEVIGDAERISSDELASIEIPAGTIMFFGKFGRFAIKQSLFVEGTPEDVALLHTLIYSEGVQERHSGSR